jgi:hypothetical protein
VDNQQRAESYARQSLSRVMPERANDLSYQIGDEHFMVGWPDDSGYIVMRYSPTARQVRRMRKKAAR